MAEPLGGAFREGVLGGDGSGRVHVNRPEGRSTARMRLRHLMAEFLAAPEGSENRVADVFEDVVSYHHFEGGLRGAAG